MMNRRAVFAATLALLAGCLATTIAQERKNQTAQAAPASSEKIQQASTLAAMNSATAAKGKTSAATGDSAGAGIRDARALRLEGEARFHANCGRCHVAPPKFPPRAMATILRHMRVRALLTDEDRRLILRYMTE
ncbi:MAG TPA: cytochrome c [Candidatus Acidoferrum sp.]|nr:cytochrome c [Candidatus Acidoferrum sp.]